MNEKVKNTILIFVLGVVLGGSVAFFFCQRAGIERVRQYTATERTIIEDNFRLRSELSDVEGRLQQYQSFNSNARKILVGQQSSIDKLREIIKNLPDN